MLKILLSAFFLVFWSSKLLAFASIDSYYTEVSISCEITEENLTRNDYDFDFINSWPDNEVKSYYLKGLEVILRDKPLDLNGQHLFLNMVDGKVSADADIDFYGKTVGNFSQGHCQILQDSFLYTDIKCSVTTSGEDGQDIYYSNYQIDWTAKNTGNGQIKMFFDEYGDLYLAGKNKMNCQRN